LNEGSGKPQDPPARKGEKEAGERGKSRKRKEAKGGRGFLESGRKKFGEIGDVETSHPKRGNSLIYTNHILEIGRSRVCKRRGWKLSPWVAGGNWGIGGIDQKGNFFFFLQHLQPGTSKWQDNDPLELQMMLCHFAVRSAKEIISGKDPQPDNHGLKRFFFAQKQTNAKADANSSGNGVVSTLVAPAWYSRSRFLLIKNGY